MSIESRRRGHDFAFPPAVVWLYFIRSPEYWIDGGLKDMGFDFALKQQRRFFGVLSH